MDGTFLLLACLVAVSLILRSMATAARNSAKEEIVREVVREHLRKKKLDELYGRDQE